MKHSTLSLLLFSFGSALCMDNNNESSASTIEKIALTPGRIKSIGPIHVLVETINNRLLGETRTVLVNHHSGQKIKEYTTFISDECCVSPNGQYRYFPQSPAPPADPRVITNNYFGFNPLKVVTFLNDELLVAATLNNLILTYNTKTKKRTIIDHFLAEKNWSCLDIQKSSSAQNSLALLAKTGEDHIEVIIKNIHNPTFRINIPLSEKISAFALAEYKQLIAYTKHPSDVFVVRPWKSTAEITLASNRITACCFSPEEEYLFGATNKGTLFIWASDTQKLIGTIKVKNKPIVSLLCTAESLLAHNAAEKIYRIRWPLLVTTLKKEGTI